MVVLLSDLYMGDRIDLEIFFSEAIQRQKWLNFDCDLGMYCGIWFCTDYTQFLDYRYDMWKDDRF